MVFTGQLFVFPLRQEFVKSQPTSFMGGMLVPEPDLSNPSLGQSVKSLKTAKNLRKSIGSSVED